MNSSVLIRVSPCSSVAKISTPGSASFPGMGQIARILYLPGNDSPEVWSWGFLKEKPEAEKGEGGMYEFVNQVQDTIMDWRSFKS